MIVEMEAEIERLLKAAEEQLEKIQTQAELTNWQIKYFGKSGKFNQLTKSLVKIPIDKRASLGKLLNLTKNKLTEKFKEKEQSIKAANQVSLDISQPSLPIPTGHLHIITQTIEQIVEIFRAIGFVRVRYPEVEWDYFAFEALNMPKDHPARDEWETFFISDKIVLTPHTSSGQVREMRKSKLPIRMLNIAKCYRRQSDISHTPMFHQFEGLLVDRQVSIRDLKGVLDYFVKSYYGPERKTRLRPFHFRFTEPSFEVDISCNLCKGLGCRICKEGWLELGGAGMVHPKVLAEGGIDPEKYSGFAFGWGVERVLTISGVKIPDLRLLYQNDLRFLEQF